MLMSARRFQFWGFHPRNFFGDWAFQSWEVWMRACATLHGFLQYRNARTHFLQQGRTDECRPKGCVVFAYAKYGEIFPPKNLVNLVDEKGEALLLSLAQQVRTDDIAAAARSRVVDGVARRVVCSSADTSRIRRSSEAAVTLAGGHPEYLQHEFFNGLASVTFLHIFSDTCYSQKGNMCTSRANV
jgi:hypothetical protein